PAISGSYNIVIDPNNPLGQSYTGTVDLEPIPTAGSWPNAATPYTGIAPRFQNYAMPRSQGGNAGEPSINFDPNTNNVMYEAGLQTLKVKFDDSASPAAATWSDVSSLTTSRTS